MSLWAVDTTPIELRADATEEDLQIVIRTMYKQVLGNKHLMECDRLTRAESLLRNRDITVRKFVNVIAQSELYKSLFFESSSQYRFIELNCKHLLGRPPLDQAEIAEHVRIYNERGYVAEISSYIDSDDYIHSFGDNIVPYPRAVRTQTGIKNISFNRMFTLLRGPATSDKDNHAKLITSVAANLPTPIRPPVSGSGAYYGNTGKRFRIVVSQSNFGSRTRLGQVEYVVDYSQLSQKVQTIHKIGGHIASITEVA